jgi:8-oxo-dGTP diphosphatase
MDNYHGALNKVEILDNIFIVDKGVIKILLLKKETEPYKGYWSLPRGILESSNTVLEEANMISSRLAGMNDVYFLENNVYSDLNRFSDERVLGISCIGFIDSVTLALKGETIPYEYNWFDVTSLPKMVYDHARVASDAVLSLKSYLNNFDVIKKLFPSDFTLPELQNVYEQVQGSSLDRRNFRKKIMALDVLEFTGENNIGESGRPAKLYRFKDEVEGI